MDMRDEWISDLRAWAANNDNIRELWLFGSRSKGTSRPDSDVDIAILLMPHVEAAITYTDSRDEWRAELRTIVGRDVSLEPIGPGFQFDSVVRTSGVLLWRRE
jgi:predicted nucleotidyltransferase